MTGSDEMQFLLGVGTYFSYKVGKSFAPKAGLWFEPGTVSFPCFTGEAIWIQATEFDDVSNDQ